MIVPESAASAYKLTEELTEEITERLPVSAIEATIAPGAIPLVPLSGPPQPVVPSTQKTSTVRISVEQLKKINNTFETLILNRNAVNLKLEQLQSFSELMQERMAALTSFNTELRQWYDRASMEGAMSEGVVAGGTAELANNRIRMNGASNNGTNRAVAIAAPKSWTHWNLTVTLSSICWPKSTWRPSSNLKR